MMFTVIKTWDAGVVDALSHSGRNDFEQLSCCSRLFVVSALHAMSATSTRTELLFTGVAALVGTRRGASVRRTRSNTARGSTIIREQASKAASARVRGSGAAGVTPRKCSSLAAGVGVTTRKCSTRQQFVLGCVSPPAARDRKRKLGLASTCVKF
jgi:hypothetical protein